MQDALHELLGKRRDRVIATLLTVKDRELDRYLPAEVSGHMRKVILNQINDWHNFVLDVLESMSTDGVTLNEIYLDKIDAMHEMLTNGK